MQCHVGFEPLLCVDMRVAAAATIPAQRKAKINVGLSSSGGVARSSSGGNRSTGSHVVHTGRSGGTSSRSGGSSGSTSRSSSRRGGIFQETVASRLHRTTADRKFPDPLQIVTV